jgi:DNA adenine methylase
MVMMDKPLFMWAGGKNKMLKHYAPYMPDDVRSYCEPFFGGGAMYVSVMNTYRPAYARINDINPDIMRIYRSIKSNLPEFTARLNRLEAMYLSLSTDDRKTFYYRIRQDHAYRYASWSQPVEAATLYFLMKTGFNGIFQINQNTNHRYGTPSGLLNQKDKVYDRGALAWWHEALQKTDIQCGRWSDAVSDCPAGTFFFFDPPYRDSFANYNNTFTDDVLRELISFCDTQPNVMLSNRDDHNWFENECKTLNIAHFDVFYTAGRRKKTENGYNAKKAREILLYRTDRSEGLWAKRRPTGFGRLRLPFNATME